MTIRLCVAVAAGLASTAAFSGEGDASPLAVAQDRAKDPALFEFAYSSPSSPALPLIGLGEDQITRVTDLRKFGMSLATDLAGSGNGSGVAMDVSPYWLFSGETMSLEDYRKQGFLAQAFLRGNLGMAYTGGKKDAEDPIRSGVSISWSMPLLRRNDPLAATTAATEEEKAAFGNPALTEVSTFGRCLAPAMEAASKEGNEAREAARAAANAQGMDAEKAWAASLAAFDASIGANAGLKAARAKCEDEIIAEMRRRSGLDVGIGVRLTGQPGSLNELRGSGTILWTTFRSAVLLRTPNPDRGKALRARLAAHARWTIGESHYDKMAVYEGSSDRFQLVAGVESAPPAGGDEPFRWSLQGGWTSQKSPNQYVPDKDFGRFLANAAIKISEGLWATGTLGRVQGRGVEDDTYFLFGFAFSPPARGSAF